MGKESKLEGAIEDILEDIISGLTFREIANKYNVAIGTLHKYLNRSEHSARTSAALELSASSYADKAEQVLIEAEKDKIEISRARELAQHYRWKASKRSPKTFGDKLDLTSGGEKMNNIPSIEVVFKDFSEDEDENDDEE